LGDNLQCPFHGFEYDPMGRVTVIPANGRAAAVPKAFRVNRYPVYEAHGLIWIWWGEDAPAELEPPRFFADLGAPFSYATARDPWEAHYSRVIENQLDVAHLPFIHANTIGRGSRTIADGPVVRWINDGQFQLFVYNRPEDGTPARKASEIQVDPEKDFRLEFIFPNLWQNRISDSVRIVAAFVPVDENRTMLYLRFYQKVVRLPVLRGVFNRLAMPSNLYIAHQDRRVVETHDPQPSALRVGEQLVHADGPIVEYRRRREALKGEGGESRRPGQ
jgi:phenylpropionate dioxygenase-like ring-hydroxylating dioxygenase large terminal subunit